MATCTVLKRKSGERYVKIRCKPHRKGQEFTKVWDFPQSWSDVTALKRAQKVADQFAEDCRAGKVRPKRAAALEREGLALKDTRTLKGYAENVFLPRLALRASQYTLDCYRRALKNHVFPVLGEKDASSITPAEISALLFDLQARGYKVASVVKTYTVLQGVFASAFDDGSLLIDPMQRVKRPKPTAAEGIKTGPAAYTAEEVRSILEASNTLPLRWRSLFMLCCETGCRRGEALGLRWSDVDTESGSISFRQALGFTDETGFFTKPPKNGRTRSVYTSSALIEMLKELRQEQERETGEEFPGINPHSGESDFVFQIDATGSPMRPDTVTQKFKRFGEQHGIDHLYPHKLRHSFASIATRYGADIAAVSATLGHTNPATTMRIYTHTNTEAVKRAGALVQSAIAGI